MKKRRVFFLEGESSWILKRFELIPEKLVETWRSAKSWSFVDFSPKSSGEPVEIFSTIDVFPRENHFLSFESNEEISPFDLEFSLDFGVRWSKIDRIPTIVSKLDDFVVRQPLNAIGTFFYVPIEPFRSSSKNSIRFRWKIVEPSISNESKLENVRITDECSLICDFEPCSTRCLCKTNGSCVVKPARNRTFFHGPIRNFSKIFKLTPLNLLTTKFVFTAIFPFVNFFLLLLDFSKFKFARTAKKNETFNFPSNIRPISV